MNSTLADSVPSFPAQSFSQSLHLSFYKHRLNLANAEMLLCILQSSGDHERGQNLHVQAEWEGGGGSAVCADSFRVLGKQWRVASEVCLSPSVGVKRSLVIKAELPLLPDRKGRKSEEAEKESGRDKEERREAGIVDEKRNKWKF